MAFTLHLDVETGEVPLAVGVNGAVLVRHDGKAAERETVSRAFPEWIRPERNFLDVSLKFETPPKVAVPPFEIKVRPDNASEDDLLVFAWEHDDEPGPLPVDLSLPFTPDGKTWCGVWREASVIGRDELEPGTEDHAALVALSKSLADALAAKDWPAVVDLTWYRRRERGLADPDAYDSTSDFHALMDARDAELRPIEPETLQFKTICDGLLVHATRAGAPLLEAWSDRLVLARSVDVWFARLGTEWVVAR